MTIKAIYDLALVSSSELKDLNSQGCSASMIETSFKSEFSTKLTDSVDSHLGRESA
jgi:hypothetical protein